MTELWKWSPEESVRFANLLPPEREEEYGKSVPPDEREARRLRGLRPFVSRPRYTWERVRLWFILAAIVVGVLGATRACKKDDGNTPDEPAEVSDQ